MGPLYAAIRQVMDGLGERYEIIAVDDGSHDNTLLVLKNLPPLCIMVIVRNSGQTAVLDAGFVH